MPDVSKMMNQKIVNPICLVCKCPHKTTDFETYDEFYRQKKIKEYMVTLNLTFQEAEAMVRSHTYALAMTNAPKPVDNKNLLLNS